jgi:hypothetical protein
MDGKLGMAVVHNTTKCMHTRPAARSEHTCNPVLKSACSTVPVLLCRRLMYVKEAFHTSEREQFLDIGISKDRDLVSGGINNISTYVMNNADTIEILIHDGTMSIPQALRQDLQYDQNLHISVMLVSYCGWRLQYTANANVLQKDQSASAT